MALWQELNTYNVCVFPFLIIKYLICKGIYMTHMLSLKNTKVPVKPTTLLRCSFPSFRSCICTLPKRAGIHSSAFGEQRVGVDRLCIVY